MISYTTEDEESPEISIVVPLYNEEENIKEVHRRVTHSMESLGLNYELVLVNDGSKDSTPALVKSLKETDRRVVGIHLSRNFGHQAAICAGIDHARGKAVVLMDGDLQDPPEVIEQFIRSWREGYQVVYAIRTKRKENLFKLSGYFLFYRLLRAISDLDIPLDSGDFCLMDRRVVNVLKHLPERMRFVRGLRTFVGFRQVGVSYQRAAREAGTPKYSFRALVRLAVDGLVSFSSVPLKLVTYLGVLSAGLAACLTIGLLGVGLYNQTAPPGWACAMALVVSMGAVQLLSLGLIGEYIHRIFLETKRRPTYVLSDVQRTQSGKARPRKSVRRRGLKSTQAASPS